MLAEKMISPSNRRSWSWIWIPVLFLMHLALTALAYYCIYSILRKYLNAIICSAHFTWPSTFEESKRVIEKFRLYYEAHPILVFAFHCAGFLFLQTWCIPGTVFYNLFGGAIFGMALGWSICLFVLFTMLTEVAEHIGGLYVLLYIGSVRCGIAEL